MEDSHELKFTPTPEEQTKLEHSDLCVTLYTIWDRLQERGEVAGRYLYSCRNDSCVPDGVFGQLAKTSLNDCETLVDRGELFVLASMPLDHLRHRTGCALQVALEAL